MSPRAFNHSHYVPVLRWKAAEREALAALDESVKNRITPLIEIQSTALPGDAQPSDTVQKLLGQFTSCWCQRTLFSESRRAFVDVHLLTTVQAELVAKFIKAAHAAGFTVVPVVTPEIGLSLRRSLLEIADKAALGLCLRVPASDNAAGLQQTVEAELAKSGVAPEAVDLVIDCQVVDTSAPSLETVCSAVPHASRWRSLTVCGGAFPENLVELSVDNHYLPRLEWRRWRDGVLANRGGARIPTYSDYTIQHPIYREPPEFPSVSASVRYTLEDTWLVMRGESLSKDDGPGYRQYPAHAVLLSQSGDFCGADFSYGDRYVAEKSDLHTSKTGNPQTWLRAGFNHHITFVVRQLANLFDSPAAVGF